MGSAKALAARGAGLAACEMREVKLEPDVISQGIGRARRRPGRRWHVGAIAMTLPCRSTRKSSTQRCRAGVNGPRFAAIVNDFPDRPAIQDKRQKNALHMKVVDAKDMPGIGCDNHFRV